MVTERATTTASRASLPPKGSEATGLDTSERVASSSIDVPSKPRAAKSSRAVAMSCSRRSAAVILLRGADLREVLTAPSCQRGQQLQRQHVTGRRGGASTSDGSAGGGWVSGGVVGLGLGVESLGPRPEQIGRAKV